MTDFLKNPESWKAIREEDKYKALRDELFGLYNEFCKEREIPVLKFSDEMMYFKNGSRAEFERAYFLRRKQMSIYAVLSLLYPENEEYFRNLCDVVAEICNEYSWQVPAHRPAENRNKNDGHSLFAAETAMYLAEIKHIFYERMDPCLISRITDAIEKKILSSYESRITGVEQKEITNNWAPVCAGSIGVAFMYEAPERFEKIRSRVEKCMENYLRGISSDGGTNEGASYWNYGFAFYVLYYDTVRRMKGETDGLKKEKVKKLAGFLNSIMFDAKNVISFSDSSSEAGCHISLAYFLKKEYGIPVPPEATVYLDPSETSVFLRDFLYYDPDLVNESLPESERYFDELEWYIKRGKNYSFAVKGGKNDIEDNHNHNDIGSFIVFHNGKQVLCDLGSPQYTALNFGATRYRSINNSSLGHSVPIICETEQGVGDGFYGRLTADGKISVDMKNAYPINLKKLVRSFSLSESSLCLTDEFDFGLDITERLVSDIEPNIAKGYTVIDKTVITTPAGYSVSVSKAETTKHDGTPREVYFIDFKPLEKTDKFILEINFYD